MVTRYECYLLPILLWNRTTSRIQTKVWNNLCFLFKAELLQLIRIQFSSLGIFVSKKVGIQKKLSPPNIQLLKLIYVIKVVLFF